MLVKDAPPAPPAATHAPSGQRPRAALSWCSPRRIALARRFRRRRSSKVLQPHEHARASPVPCMACPPSGQTRARTKGSFTRGLERRLGGRGCGRLRSGGTRQRHRRLHPRPREHVRCRRRALGQPPPPRFPRAWTSVKFHGFLACQARARPFRSRDKRLARCRSRSAVAQPVTHAGRRPGHAEPPPHSRLRLGQRSLAVVAAAPGGHQADAPGVRSARRPGRRRRLTGSATG